MDQDQQWELAKGLLGLYRDLWTNEDGVRDRLRNPDPTTYASLLAEYGIRAENADAVKVHLESKPSNEFDLNASLMDFFAAWERSDQVGQSIHVYLPIPPAGLMTSSPMSPVAFCLAVGSY
jgi:hypothetical protein